MSILDSIDEVLGNEDSWYTRLQINHGVLVFNTEQVGSGHHCCGGNLPACSNEPALP